MIEWIVEYVQNVYYVSNIKRILNGVIGLGLV